MIDGCQAGVFTMMKSIFSDSLSATLWATWAEKKWFFRTFKRDALWRPFIHYGRLWRQEGWAGLNSVWCEGKPINILTVGEKLLQDFAFILYKMITNGHLTVISMMSMVGYLQTSSKCPPTKWHLEVLCHFFLMPSFPPLPFFGSLEITYLTFFHT